MGDPRNRSCTNAQELSTFQVPEVLTRHRDTPERPPAVSKTQPCCTRSSSPTAGLAVSVEYLLPGNKRKNQRRLSGPPPPQAVLSRRSEYLLWGWESGEVPFAVEQSGKPLLKTPSNGVITSKEAGAQPCVARKTLNLTRKFVLCTWECLKISRNMGLTLLAAQN